MSSVTLALRLLLSIGLLAILTTLALTFAAREAWKQAEEELYRERFAAAVSDVETDLRELADLEQLLEPLCRHQPIVDSALVGLRRDDLDTRRMPISLQVPEMMKSLRLDELALVTHQGEILGAGHQAGAVGASEPALARRLKELLAGPRIRRRPEPLSIEAACIHRDASAPDVWVGLIGARHLGPMLHRAGARSGIELNLSKPQTTGQLSQNVNIAELGTLTLTATRSNAPLLGRLAQLNRTMLWIGGGTFAASLALAMLISRSLARPIARLSQQAREVVHGDPKPVQAGGGGRELKELTDAFNRAIADLVSLRKQLAATERIAARREIARRVAHEIKNPLAPIQAAIETLRRLRARDDPSFDSYFEEATRTVLDEVRRISNIVSEFTRFARLPAPEPETMDFMEVARSVVGLHANRGAEVRLITTDNPPEIKADRDQLVQVLTNLLNNAQEALDGRTDGRIDVCVEHDDRELTFSVRDNGPGVEEHMRDRLFEPYATSKKDGTGLGLAIVERIIVEHGGSIHHRAPKNGGAEMVIRLPIKGPKTEALSRLTGSRPQ